ncbi:MAG: hypothetical protein HYR88_10820, partial [Verrucomicrobia bacterium]|nr:hypothetical protein [Verrucomicrobiota bacterium]
MTWVRLLSSRSAIGWACSLAWGLALPHGAFGGQSAINGGIGSRQERARRDLVSEEARVSVKPGRAADEWTLVSPEGEPFFSLGVCVLDQGRKKEDADPDNPGYGGWRHYATPSAWADSAVRRLRSWGFTTAAGWADVDALAASSEPAMWLTPVLHIGSTAGAPWWDMWDPRNLRRMDDVARGQMLHLARSRPKVLGYYSDNELGWWNATLWKMTWEQPAQSGQRQRLVRLVQDTYRHNWEEMAKDFDVESADSWSSLGRRGILYLRSGGQGIRVMRRFLGMLADRYYQVMREIIHRYDPRALYLGDRYQSFYYPEVVEAAGRYVDVVSSNLNAAWNDGAFPRFQLDTLHSVARKPILVTEIYMAAQENRSGDRNSMGVYPVAGTQAERSRSLRSTLESLAALPYVVGVDWFQFYDEPRHGRDDGENFNFGLVDIFDRPYEEVTGVFSSFDPTALRKAARPVRADARGGAPRAPRDPMDGFTGNAALASWDRERGFVPCSTPHPQADLYTCWNPDAILLVVFAHD